MLSSPQINLMRAEMSAQTVEQCKLGGLGALKNTVCLYVIYLIILLN